MKRKYTFAPGTGGNIPVPCKDDQTHLTGPGLPRQDLHANCLEPGMASVRTNPANHLNQH